jgi:hypothetical protein
MGAFICVFGSKLDLGLTRFRVENLLLKKNSSSAVVVAAAMSAAAAAVWHSFRHASFLTNYQQADIECRLLIMLQTTMRSL